MPQPRTGNISFVVFIAAILLRCMAATAQDGPAHNCNATLVVDMDFHGAISLYNKPHGTVAQKLKHNFAGKDYLLLQILDKEPNMFYVKAFYSASGHAIYGWVYRDDPNLIIYTRDYDRYVKLYLSPEKSPHFKEVKEYTYQDYHVTDCYAEWLYVYIDIKGKHYEGWLPPGMQCARPEGGCR